MTLTKKMTRNMREANCTGCKLVLKRALKLGGKFCKRDGEVEIKNGICQQRK